MTTIYDFVIIGSGPSGSALAYYLSRAGARCLLLEAGKAWDARTFPSNEMAANARLMWNGGMDASTDTGLLFLRGKALGGGSIINQCLLDRFDDIALDDWRDRSGLSAFSTDAMARHYDEVESHLDLHTFEPHEWNGNARIYADAFDKCEMQWAPLRRGQNRCEGNDCIVCLGGCPRDSKQSMLVTFLEKAGNQGLEIETEFEVGQVVHGKSFVTVYGQQRGQYKTVYGQRCIVAAGSLGTNRLLLKSGYQHRLPALGEGFTCHPQFMNIAMMPEVVDAHKGALQSLKSNDPRFRRQGFKLENVFAGPIAIALLKLGYGYEHMRYMQRYRHMACIEVAVRDASAGRIQVDGQGRLRVQKRLTDADWHRANAGLQVVDELFAAAGATEVMKSPIRIGLHLMGGCAIGVDGASSVVNPEFQVHDHPRLYIADSSVFPSAPGINPSLTIMALAHRACEHILRHCHQGGTDVVEQRIAEESV